MAENFLFSREREDAHLKAIDFGLATPFDPAHLPLQVSVLEGTPWYDAQFIAWMSIGQHVLYMANDSYCAECCTSWLLEMYDVINWRVSGHCLAKVLVS